MNIDINEAKLILDVFGDSHFDFGYKDEQLILTARIIEAFPELSENYIADSLHDVPSKFMLHEEYIDNTEKLTNLQIAKLNIADPSRLEPRQKIFNNRVELWPYINVYYYEALKAVPWEEIKKFVNAPGGLDKLIKMYNEGKSPFKLT